MDEGGASIVVAVIILLLMTMVLVGGLSVILMRFRPADRLEVELELRKELNKHGLDELILIHKGGERIKNAIRLIGGRITWKDLEVRVNGIKCDVQSGATLNGDSNPGDVDLVFKDTLRFPLGRRALFPGDWAEVIYRNQVLLWGQI